MKKNILISIILFFCNTGIYCQNQDMNCTDVDSLFLVHFLSLDKTINCDTLDIFVSPHDSRFIYIISYLSGIPFTLHSYSGHPILNKTKLLSYKDWYLQYRQKIKCESYIKAADLLNQIIEINFNITHEQLIDQELDILIKELDKLKIE